MTFSIVASQGESLGVAVASKFIAVGAVVPEVRLGVGAAATQASAKVSYRADVLDLLSGGTAVVDAVAQVTTADDGRSTRQLGVVSATGQASYTGSDCSHWAGGVAQEASEADGVARYAIQGNILVGPQVVEAMEMAFRESAGRPLARRLIAALLAGDAAGGDSRGRQAAALVVHTPGTGYDASGVTVDLRVDDHQEAPTELARLLDLNDLYFGEPDNLRPLAGELAQEVRTRLATLGYTHPDNDDPTTLDSTLEEWAGVENYEMRLVRGQIDALVLEALRRATPDI